MFHPSFLLIRPLLDLLMPLKSPARLPKHPSLSIAYTSPILTNMAQHACELLQRERKTLAGVKRLMTKLRGDESWIPCELMYTWKDEAIFDTKKLYNGLVFRNTAPRSNGIAARSLVNGSTNGASLPGSPKSSQSGTELGSASETITGTHEGTAMEITSGVENADINGAACPEDSPNIRPKDTRGKAANGKSETVMLDGDVPEGVPSEGMPEVPEPTTKALDDETRHTVNPTISITGEHRPEIYTLPDIGESSAKDENMNGTANTYSTQDASSTGNGFGPVLAARDDAINHPGTPDAEEPKEEEAMDGIEEEDTVKPEPRRMRTRAQAQAASEPTVSSRTDSPDWVIPKIHPIFKIPESAIPDKDFGLPPSEADETRRLLTMYVQKQEEVCRGAEKLYEGLLRADRQRRTVLEWCKAEGHVGEMSDGEDWYDKEEWGLEEDLEKGHNDEEGDNNAIQGRKPRRRA